MGDWWAAVVVGLGICGWTVYVDVRHDSDGRLATWWVSRARTRGRWVGPCSLLISVGALAGYGLLALLGSVLATDLGDKSWALLIAGPAMLAYAPFVWATAPLGVAGYSFWRRELESAGADGREQRGIAWWAGPPSFLGLLVMIATLWSIFDS